MRKYVWILLLTLSMVLSGCAEAGVHDGIKQNNTENVMSLTASSARVSAGNEAVITVRTKDNPGFLAMALVIRYEADVMTLVQVEKGSDFSEYNFVPANNLSDGCRVAWFATEVRGESEDGELLKLYFQISESAGSGSYSVSIIPIDDGSIVDRNKRSITVEGKETVITIE